MIHLGGHKQPGYSPEVNEILSFYRRLRRWAEDIRVLRNTMDRPVMQFKHVTQFSMEVGILYETRYAGGQTVFTAADFVELTKALLEIAANE